MRNGARFSTGSVSGWRIPNQIVTKTASTRNMTKIIFQYATSRMPWPSSGAMIGTVMKTPPISDMMRAIGAPSYWSRTSAASTTRGIEAPSPCNTRAVRKTE